MALYDKRMQEGRQGQCLSAECQVRECHTRESLALSCGSWEPGLGPVDPHVGQDWESVF